MKKSALIVAQRNSPTVSQLEKAILMHGFDTLRVGSKREALYRLGNEIFSVLICVDESQGSFQSEFVEALLSSPLGMITPIVILSSKQEVKEPSQSNSLLDQYFALSTDPQLIAEFCEETHILRAEKAKRGRLGTISIPQILQQAATLRLNGAVVVEQEDEKCIMYLENGFVVFASSNRDENRFGEFLVHQGIISREQYNRAVRVLATSDKRFGHILVEEGIIKPQVLQTLIQSQVKHIIYTVFDWPAGEYYILFDEKSGQGGSIARFDIASLVLEGVRYKFTEQRLTSEFEPFDQKVSLGIPLAEVQRQIHLDKNEFDFLRLIGLGRPIVDMLNLNSYSRLESLKFLYAFKILGVIAFEQGITPVQKFIPKNVERAKAVEELFGNKVANSKIERELPIFPEPMKDIDTSIVRRSRYVNFLLGALALSVFVAITTFVDPRASRESQSMAERKLITLDPSPHTLSQKPVVTPTPSSEIELKAQQKMSEPQSQQNILSPPLPADQKMVVASVMKDIELGKGDRLQKLIERAQKQEEGGELEAALRSYRQASKVDPRNIDTQLAIGDLLFELDQSEEAKMVFEKVIKVDPTNARPYLSLGTIFLLDAQKERAARALRKYLALVRKTPETQGRIIETQKILQTLE